MLHIKLKREHTLAYSLAYFNFLNGLSSNIIIIITYPCNYIFRTSLKNLDFIHTHYFY